MPRARRAARWHGRNRWPALRTRQLCADHVRAQSSSRTRAVPRNSAARCAPRSWPANTARMRLRVEGRIAARQLPGLAGRQPEQSRAAHGALDASGSHVEQCERTYGRGLVPARLAMHDERPLDGHPGQRCGEQFGGGQTVGADEVKRRLGGIGQRAEHVEHRAHAERGADRSDGLQCRVIVRSEEECKARGIEAAARRHLIERHRHPQGRQQVGATRATGDRAVAVLGDAHAAGRGQQGRTGGEIQAARSIARLSPRHRRVRRPAKGWLAGEPSHRTREAADLVGRDAVAAQRREQRARQSRRKRPGRSVPDSRSSACASLRCRRCSSCSSVLRRPATCAASWIESVDARGNSPSAAVPRV